MRKRAVALGGLILMAAVGVLTIQRLNADQHYRELLATGERALQNGRSHEAIEAFTAAIGVRATSMVAYFRRGEAYAAAGQDDRALRDLHEARRLTPDAAEPLEALGRLAESRGNPGEAAAWYAQAVDRLKLPEPRLLYALAVARYRAGSPATAREPLKRAVARDGSMAEAHYMLGLVSRDIQELDEAAVALEHAIRLVPTMVPAREELADLYRVRGQTADELLQRRALATIDPGIERYLSLAMACLRAGRFEDAEAALGQAEAIDASDSRIALLEGRLHLAEAEDSGSRTAVAEALAALERALGGTARRSEGLALYGRALHLSGDLPAAERLLRDAILTSPVDPEAFLFLADTAEALHHPALARDALLKLDALEGDTVSGAARAGRARRVGALALEAGDARMGAAYLTAAVDAGLGDAATLGLLARARWQSGDAEGARAALGQALALDARNTDLRRIARTIR